MHSARIALWKPASCISTPHRLTAAPPGWVTVLCLCALAVLPCVLTSCGGASAQTARPRALVGDQNTGVLHGQYIWKSQGFSTSNHIPFVEAGQMYFDGAGRHWGSSTMNVDGTSSDHICAAWCGGTYNVNDRYEGTFTAARQYGDTCNLEVTIDGSTAYCVSTDTTSTWIMEFTKRGD